MADTTISPNMGLPVPVPETAPGPDWATNIVADMYAIDSHNHSAGQGVPVTPDGLNINSDLTFLGNNATRMKSVIFSAQSAPLSGGSYLGCVYVSGKDLYYNDEDGNQVRITTSGSVNAGAGSITGLPSGTASVAFSGGTYTFQSATSTGATISCGPVAIGSTTASAKHTTIASNASQASDISLVLPTTAPAAASVLKTDASGNMSWGQVTGTGFIVAESNASMDHLTVSSSTLTLANISSSAISTSTLIAPFFSGLPTGTVIGAAFTPTVTWTKTLGSALTLTNNTRTFYYNRIGNTVFVNGTVNVTVSGYTSGSSLYYMSSTIPISSAALAVAGIYTSESAGASITVGTMKADSTTGAKWNDTVVVNANVTFNVSVSYSYIIS